MVEKLFGSRGKKQCFLFEGEAVSSVLLEPQHRTSSSVFQNLGLTGGDGDRRIKFYIFQYCAYLVLRNIYIG